MVDAMFTTISMETSFKSRTSMSLLSVPLEEELLVLSGKKEKKDYAVNLFFLMD